jgi:CheY-like chemotaxis protein
VLLAEDDRAMRELVACELRREGCEVTEAASGEALVAQLAALLSKGATLDLVIADVRMPGAGGLEALAMLRSAERPPPVILISAFGGAALHELAARLGAAAFFDKPFDLDELCAVVRNLLAIRSGEHR